MSIWGEDSDKKEAHFYEIVEEIQAKYPHVFENELNPITREKPGKLAFELMTTYDGNMRTVGFHNGTYVPDYIQQEVFTAFREVFAAK